MITEALTIIKYIGIFGGGGIITLFLSKWLGKKKEEVELALDWQKFYNEHIETIKKIHEEEIESIKKMHKQQIVEVKLAFKKEIQVLKEDMQTFTALFNQQKESHKKELMIWEDKHNKQLLFIKGQEKELENLRKGID